MTGSHEVSGSIPLISTKAKSHSVRNGFLLYPDMSGVRNLRFDRLHFCGTKALFFLHEMQKNIGKCNRHGGGKAAGVSRLSVCFPFPIIGRIFAVMRLDPDLTKTGLKTRWFY